MKISLANDSLLSAFLYFLYRSEEANLLYVKYAALLIRISEERDAKQHNIELKCMASWNSKKILSMCESVDTRLSMSTLHFTTHT